MTNMRQLRTSEIIHRLDDAVGFYNLKHSKRLQISADKEASKIILLNEHGLIEAEISNDDVYQIMHNSSKKRNRMIEVIITKASLTSSRKETPVSSVSQQAEALQPQN